MGALHPIDTSTNGSHPHRTLKSWEPATGELLGEVPVASRDDVLETIARARKAQAAWGVLPVEERCTRLLRFRGRDEAPRQIAIDLSELVAIDFDVAAPTAGQKPGSAG